ncbi:MAG: hypothetical protein EAX86_09355 [Candidatus Heimdallarchaeota archaeon]|nr:hypothetical protein [Candidatus Heimdallarchaeota archaeon]
MPNYFWTRKRFGRWRYDIIVIFITALFNFGSITPIILWGIDVLRPNQPPEAHIMDAIVAFIGSTFMLLLTEYLCNISYTMLKNIINREIVRGKPKEEREAEAINFIWNSKIYYLCILLIIAQLGFGVIGVALGATTILDGIFGSPVMVLSSIIYVEFFWIAFAPTMLIFYLPRLPIQLNVFESDSAGGLGAIANYLLKGSLILTAFGTFALYWVISTSAIVFEIGVMMLAVILAIPLIYFIVPTIGLRSIMIKEKYRVLDAINYQIGEVYLKLHANDQISQETFIQVQGLSTLRQQVMSMHEWPFSFTGLRNLLTSFLIPIGVFLLNNLDSLQTIISGS